MKLVALSSLFLIASACTVPVFAQAIQVAEIGQPAKLVPGSRKIDRLLMPRITLRIYDFDHVEPAAIASAKEVASEIFLQAGVETLWVDCPSQSRCLTNAPGPEFRVRMVPEALGNAMVADDSLGFAVPCASTEQACLSYVFYWRIRALGENYRIAPDRLLGHVIAHEIGHALLGTKAHELYGIMQHKLRVYDTERILYFTSGQAKRLRADLLARDAAMNRSLD